MERWIEFRPSHGSVDLLFILRGPAGAVAFVVKTNWHPSDADIPPGDHGVRPMPISVEYHSLTPKIEGDLPHKGCEFLDGRPCFFDGSALYANDVFRRLIQEGDAGVWDELERFYQRHLGGAA